MIKTESLGMISSMKTTILQLLFPVTNVHEKKRRAVALNPGVSIGDSISVSRMLKFLINLFFM